RNRPYRIAPDSNFLPRANYSPWRRFEEKLRPLRCVDAIVESAAAGVFGFFHARVARAVIGDACRPDFLCADGSAQTIRRRGWQCGLRQRLLRAVMQACISDQFVPRCVEGGEAILILRNEWALRRVVQLHGF